MDDLKDTPYDYVIVGAGAAGSPLAERLSADPSRTVLLLEAGPPDTDPAIRVPAAYLSLFGGAVDWARRTVPQPRLGGRRIYWPHGRTLGGSSSVNAMMWVRGFGGDYDEWERLAGPGWGRRAVMRWFETLEDRETTLTAGRTSGGPLPVRLQRDPNPLTADFLAACRQAGLDEVTADGHATAERGGMTLVTQRDGSRFSAADAFLRPAADRPNLTIRTGAAARRVLFAGRRATGVEYLHEGRLAVATARAEVVLCGGAVNTPHLLKLSGVGPAAELRRFGIPVVADHPEVGRNLADHLVTMRVLEAREPITLFDAASPRELIRYRRHRRGKLTSNLGEAYTFTRSDPALPLPDLELLFAPGPYLDEGLTLGDRHAFSVGAVLLQPHSRGEVTLASPDPADAPLVDPRYLSDAAGADLAALRAGAAWARKVLEAPALARHVAGSLQPAGDAADDLAAVVEQCSHSLYHPVATCRMGRDAASVVDPELRVRGLAGLRVADASVIPHLIRGHTYAPSLVVGLRAAELLAQERAPAPVAG
ncbi:GMC family oxidoreductase [Streptomyces radicis]|uniref:Glucose-methanol-choline oxidoreductase n=1 Tax=Streptomyces radicis TaxID=1750517 RepID=A0A3A9WJ10_9ACTN|nr:GMC family oxidoreductase N-terminal domain-containing protein [Streptomyces radicis]RKN12955.1 glucose-methanol-choline oxidoreductase [Streptomyces radicis]RKN27831.1 glucose-methanol-choline oxidoreductase [Streptomyces radicis]